MSESRELQKKMSTWLERLQDIQTELQLIVEKVGGAKTSARINALQKQTYKYLRDVNNFKDDGFSHADAIGALPKNAPDQVAIIPDKLEALAPELTAAPNFPGYGSFTPAGRGGKVIKVTNRNDSGPGSFRAAVEASGPRNVVFTVGGEITLKSPIEIKNKFISIYGQTAPGKGVVFTYAAGHEINRSPIWVLTTDVLLMHLRSRPRPASIYTSNLDCISIDGRVAGKVSVINCSFSFGTDENMEIWYPAKDITIALNTSFQGIRNDDVNPYGGIIGNDPGQPYVERVSAYWNVGAHCTGRFFRWNATDFDQRQNVFYNPLNMGTEVDARNTGQTIRCNIEGNIYIDGPDTKYGRSGVDQIHFSGSGAKQAYVDGNVRILKDGSQVQAKNSGSFTRLSERIDSPMPELIPPDDLVEFVLNNAGAKPSDGTDASVIGQIRQRKGTFNVSSIDNYPPASGKYQSVPFDAPQNVDGQPLLADNGSDCIPDSFKLENGFDVSDNLGQIKDAVGYSLFEHYVHTQF